jgi:signal peptidase I
VLLTGFSIVVVRILFVNLSRVPTGAMANTILPGDQLVSKKSFGDIARGKVVIFRYPGDEAKYVARVIGLPGETIQLDKRSLLINGQPLEEERVFVKQQDVDFESLEEIKSEGKGSYRVFYVWRGDEDGEDNGIDPSTFGVGTPFKIPGNCYFMLGDNRENSYDSRYRGCVPRELIWGVTEYIYWSQPMRSEQVRWERIGKPIK